MCYNRTYEFHIHNALCVVWLYICLLFKVRRQPPLMGPTQVQISTKSLFNSMQKLNIIATILYIYITIAYCVDSIQQCDALSSNRLYDWLLWWCSNPSPPQPTHQATAHNLPITDASHAWLSRAKSAERDGGNRASNTQHRDTCGTPARLPQSIPTSMQFSARLLRLRSITTTISLYKPTYNNM